MAPIQRGTWERVSSVPEPTSEHPGGSQAELDSIGSTAMKLGCPLPDAACKKANPGRPANRAATTSGFGSTSTTTAASGIGAELGTDGAAVLAACGAIGFPGLCSGRDASGLDRRTSLGLFFE